MCACFRFFFFFFFFFYLVNAITIDCFLTNTKGKTFVCNAILAHVRSKGDIALPCASSGIAATNFKGGRTVHSRFGIPLKIYHSSTCNLTKKCAKLQLIKEAKVIIWDEAPMQQRWIMECVDRTLRELLENNKPFGGKTIIFSGDYRQVSCVIPRVGKAQIIQRTFTNSKLWKHVKQLHLFENERINRLKNLKTEEKERLVAFGKLLLQIGEGIYPNEDDLIQIPEKMVSKSQNVTQFIEEIYGNLKNLNPYSKDLSILKTAILTPKNEHMRQINEAAIHKFRGKLKIYKSTNTVLDEQHVCTYTTEFLNGLKINGLPEHELLLKVGAPVMILRNYDPINGVCNGTKGIIGKLSTNIIEVIIKDAHDMPKSILLHRRDMKPSDPQIGIEFQRHQFPISLAFAMTINKSQGQTLHRVGLYLEEPVFGHGQLYVALSRVIHPDNIKVFVTDTEIQGKLDAHSAKVYTKNVVFHEILLSAGLIQQLPQQSRTTIVEQPERFDFDYDAEFECSDDEWL